MAGANSIATGDKPLTRAASTTHSQSSEEELLSAGAGPDVVRISVGIEHVNDIIADLAQALDGV